MNLHAMTSGNRSAVMFRHIHSSERFRSVRMKHRSGAKSVRSGTKQLFREYCSCSSVHGVQYLGSQDRSWCERFWWIVVFVLSIGSCALLIRKVYQKWEQTPVIVSFAEKTTPVWQIPFPAVTICPQTKASGERLNFTSDLDEYHKMSPEERAAYNKTDYLLAMIQLCDRIAYKFLEKFVASNKTSNQSYASLIYEMSIPHTDIMEFCTIQSEWTPCRILFSHTMTEEGICLTFNGLSAGELLRTDVLQSEDKYLSESRQSPQWTLEEGYSSQANLSSYPYRILGPGLSAGLSLNLMTVNENTEYLCSGPVQGFKVLLHSAAEYPQVSKKFVRIPMDQEVMIAVKPQMISTTAGLRGYTPERRHCFFNHERFLQFFRVYTQDNCELECLTNYTLESCGCVKFSMLRTNWTAVCETYELSCVLEAESNLLEMDVVGHEEKSRNFRADCNCLPACTTVQYDAEVTQTDFDWVNWARALKVPMNETKGLHLARLGIYFKEAQFMTSKRSELYGLTDFLANCGGLLGLCMGVSLLSLVELLYFCSVRPIMLWRSMRVSRRRQSVEAPAISLLSMAVKKD